MAEKGREKMVRIIVFIGLLLSISSIIALNSNFTKNLSAEYLTYDEMNSKFGGNIDLEPANKYICQEVQFSTMLCQQPPNSHNCVGVYYRNCVWNGDPVSNCYPFEHEQPICGGPDPSCLDDYTFLDCM